MLMTTHFGIFFTLLSRKSKSEAQTKKPTFFRNLCLGNCVSRSELRVNGKMAISQSYFQNKTYSTLYI